MADNTELHGYLTTGIFTVNDYKIEIERVDNGMKMTVTDGDGAVQSVVVKDGEAGMTDEEIANARTLFTNMANALTTWTANEEARDAAEKLREIAENGASGETDQTKYRTGLYNLMLELYNDLKDYQSTVDDLVKQASDLAEAAASSAAKAESAAENAEKIVYDEWETLFFYKDGDTLRFKDDDNTSSVYATSDSTSNNLCASGYVTSSGKSIHLKFPLAKSLYNITSVTFTCFTANIANSGGYGLSSGYVEAGNDYLNCIKQTVIDKVQNCIHVILERSNGRAFSLSNNEPVTCRTKDIIFVLNVTSE